VRARGMDHFLQPVRLYGSFAAHIARPRAGKKNGRPSGRPFHNTLTPGRSVCR
jgi:hypothetical protein